MCVASRSHAFATVSFTPQTMQTYQCIFEATLDGLPRYQLPSSPPPAGLQAMLSVECPSCLARLTGLYLPVPCSILAKNRSLVFDIVGEGNLPRVTVVRPVLYNQYGNLLLLFKRLLLGRSETLPLILKNSGAIPAKVLLEGEHGVKRESLLEARLLMLGSLPSLTCEDFCHVPHMGMWVRHGACRGNRGWSDYWDTDARHTGNDVARR